MRILDLEPADRAEVAENALRSLGGTAYGELNAAWEDEIRRRSRAIDDGSAELSQEKTSSKRSKPSCRLAVAEGSQALPVRTLRAR